MRCFLAIDVSDALKEIFLDAQKSFSDLAKVKFVEKENLHITLKFFGDVEEKIVKKLVNNLNLLEKESSFEIVFRGIGAFPNNRFVRVLWIGVYGLEDLQKKINEIAEKFGFASKKEKPHLTLGRVKSVKNKKEFIDLLKKNEDKEFGRMIVDKVKLKKSILTEKGPVYEDLAIFKLS